MSMDSIRFSPGKFRFLRRKTKTVARQNGCLPRHGIFEEFCYAAGAVTAVVSGAVSTTVSSGTVPGT